MTAYFERFISVSVIYWAINILIEQLGHWIEQVLLSKNQVTQAEGRNEQHDSDFTRYQNLCGQVVLDHLDLEVLKGSHVALIGSSWS